LRKLGASNAAYGVRPEHYPLVASVLVESMATVAGDAWAPAYEIAWSDALAIVAATMLEGAEQATLAAAA
jgi:hemoglobin-like flavoprotein